MKTIVIKTQKEFDKLPKEFKELTIVEIRAEETIVINQTPGSSRVEARGSSSVEARGSSSVVALGSSSVVAWESSRVEARGSSSVEAWGSSRVVAWGSSSVVAWGSSSVVALGSSSVVAWGSSRVVALESSRVEARGSNAVWVYSKNSSVDLYGYSVAWCHEESKKVYQKVKTAAIIFPEIEPGAEAWLSRHGIKASRGKAIIYKRVSTDWKTQENTQNETDWTPGKVVEHPDWKPGKKECGEGKFHACPTPYLCDEFRSKDDDRYVAIQVAVVDLFAWDKNPSYPHKIAFRKGTVLYECDRFGKEIKA